MPYIKIELNGAKTHDLSSMHNKNTPLFCIISLKRMAQSQYMLIEHQINPDPKKIFFHKYYFYISFDPLFMKRQGLLDREST